VVPYPQVALEPDQFDGSVHHRVRTVAAPRWMPRPSERKPNPADGDAVDPAR
jgi:hypothetical protein